MVSEGRRIVALKFTGQQEFPEMNPVLEELEDSCRESGYMPCILMFAKVPQKKTDEIEVGLWINGEGEIKHQLVEDLKLMLEKFNQ
jgi:hypothetical protein